MPAAEKGRGLENGMRPAASSNLEEVVISVACSLGEATAEMLVEQVCKRLAACSSRVEVRKLIGGLVRKGLLERVPSYERGRMVLRPLPEACGEEG